MVELIAGGAGSFLVVVATAVAALYRRAAHDEAGRSTAADARATATEERWLAREERAEERWLLRLDEMEAAHVARYERLAAELEAERQRAAADRRAAAADLEAERARAHADRQALAGEVRDLRDDHRNCQADLAEMRQMIAGR